MKKIIADSTVPFLEGRLPEGFELQRLPAAEITSAAVAEADALLVSTRVKCRRELLEGSRVSFVGTATAGADHIDIGWCQEAGIEVASAPGCNAPAVAQYVWASLLHTGFNPEGATIGVIGKGNVGSIVASWGRLMGCRVLVSDPPRAELGLRDEEYLPIERVVAESDAITFHVPLTADGPHPTKGLLTPELTDQLRPGTRVVNASRGGVTDETALITAHEEKGLILITDTWAGEPAIDHRMLSASAVATPHIAGYSRAGKERATRMVLEALGRHFGVEFDTGGLAGDYISPSTVTPEAILASYTPEADSALLRGNPERFERLRKEYTLRKETEL